MLSPDGFVTFQIFSRELGPSDDRTRESTAIVGAGIRVSKRYPITFSAVVPYSWISEPGASRNGAEDALFSIRYRYDLKALQERWDREGNFVMGMGAVELNNGTIDHDRWNGPVEGMSAALGSLERGPWSLMAYGVTRFNAEDSSGSKDGNTLFTGAGAAFTPNENFATGQLLSYQAGISFEHYARDRAAYQRVEESGGNELFIHPAIAYSPGHNLLFFGIVSLPVWQNVRDHLAKTRYRVGTGIIYGW